MNEERDDQFYQEWYDGKTSLMVAALGEEHDIVSHSVLPYRFGGGLDLYYFPHGLPGTAIATKELCEDPDDCSSNDMFDFYELVMFTRQELALDDADDASTPFGRAHTNINAILNLIARYSAQATLNPMQTCEFPEEMEEVGGKCLIFDAYGDVGTTDVAFGLLAVIEIFPTEMSLAQNVGGKELLAKLKAAGHYPYSDLDRQPVA